MITDAQWETFESTFRAALNEDGADVAYIDVSGFRLVEPYVLHPRIVHRAFVLACDAAGVPCPRPTFEDWAASSYYNCDLAPRWFALHGVGVE